MYVCTYPKYSNNGRLKVLHLKGMLDLVTLVEDRHFSARNMQKRASPKASFHC